MALMKLPGAAIQCSDLLDLPVRDRNTAKIIGRVVQLWLDVETHQMVGLTCKSGLLGRQDESFPWTQVEIYGTKRIVVQPGEPPSFQERESVQWAFWREVWTAEGKKVGSIADYRIDPETGAIADYLLAAGGGLEIMPGMYALPTSAIVRANWQGLIADETRVQNAPKATVMLMSSQKTEQLAQLVEKQRREEQRMHDALLLLQQLVEREETTVKSILDCLYDVGSVNLIDEKVSAKSLNQILKAIARTSKPAFRVVAFRWFKTKCPQLIANWLHSKVSF